MINDDTIKLLRECDAGIKMGVNSIEDVLEHVENSKLHDLLNECKDKHEKLAHELESQLERFNDEGKKPNFFAEQMAKMKTEIKLKMEDTDAMIASLMTDGCNMGVKSLSRYLNQYAAASEKSKDIAKKLIALEDTLSKDMRAFL